MIKTVQSVDEMSDDDVRVGVGVIGHGGCC